MSNHTEEETRTSWRYKEEEIVVDINDDKYAVENTAKNYVIKTTLIIHNATEEDFGVYTCTMKNSLGSDTKDIFLTREGSVYKGRFCV